MKKHQSTIQRVSTRLATTFTLSVMVAQGQNVPVQRNPEPNVRRPAGIPREMPRLERNRTNNQTDATVEGIVLPAENRSINGSDNNLENPTWGQAGNSFIRVLQRAYADGISEPAGNDRPSTRAVSNALVAQEESILNSKGATDFLWQWGQFVDHDIVETPTVSPAEEFDIPVPAGDPWFDPSATGTQTIPLNRSLYEEVDGVRKQVNAISSYLDASNVYGSDDVRAFALRRLDGSGKLKTTESNHGDLLPYNNDALGNAPSSSPVFFLAGDVRANEQLGLTAVHTLFVREHNHWAEQYLDMNPQAMDEEIYQFARMIVSAEIQAITYREFLPVLLGRQAIRPYNGYNEEVRADISNSFGAAAYRIGHSLLSSTLQRLDAEGNEVEEGHLPLASAFFNPALVEDGGIASVLRGLSAQQCQELDEKLVDDVRNFLFGPPGAGGFDLAALNMQRGRDHGLPGFNDTRREMGIRPLQDFRSLSRDRDTLEALESVYDNVDQLDLWVAGLCEEDVPDSMVGRVYHELIVDQFTRLRDGDRFYYESALPEELIRLVNDQTLARIIRRNTEIGDELPDNVFVIDGDRRQREQGRERSRVPRGAGRR